MPGSSNPTGTKLVTEYLDKHGELPSLTLAKLIYREHPLVFPSVMAIRKAIQRRRGAFGKNDRTLVTHAPSPAAPKNRTGGPDPENPFGLPPSFEKKMEPFVWTTDYERRNLILSDIHVPYYNIKALTAALKEGTRQDCRGILLNGDQIDCHFLSRFEHDPEARSFPEERKTMLALLERIRELFPKAEIIWRDGNHEERLFRWLWQHPELHGLVELTWPKLMQFDRLGVQYITNKRAIYCGELSIFHGHEFSKGINAPVNAARGLFLRAKQSAMAGHWHRRDVDTKKRSDGKLIVCHTLACLCELTPAYLPYNDHVHGFGVVHQTTNGKYEVENKLVIDGRVFS